MQVINGYSIYILILSGRGQYLYRQLLNGLNFVEHGALSTLSTKAASGLHHPFRPMTGTAYESMFKVFAAFCMYTIVFSWLSM